MYKNELLPVSQARNLAKSERKIIQRKNCWVLLKKQRSNERKIKK